MSTDERLNIIDAVNSVGTLADFRKWEELESVFADHVVLDYSSMGAPVETKAPKEITTAWKGLLPGFDLTQHFISNHKVTIKDNEAECFSYVNAFHVLKNNSGNGDTWSVMGYYDHHLSKLNNKWKVDKMKLTVTYIGGNTDLPKLAMEALNAKK
jgi:hypothetical protein